MSATPVKIDAVIVDPDLDTRMRLKTATTAVYQFGKVHQLSTLKEAQAKLGGDERVDVAFLSYKYEHAELTDFIKAAKDLKQGADCAFVLIMKSKDQSSSTVASNVLIGADGFLFEPYSVDYLLEITQLAEKVKRERAKTREEAAIRFLISDVMNQVDLVAFLKGSGFDMGRHLRKFKEMCGVFNTLTGNSKEMYQRMVVDMFENAPLPKKIFQRKAYSGASARVKKKMEEKLLAELEAELADK